MCTNCLSNAVHKGQGHEIQEELKNYHGLDGSDGSRGHDNETKHGILNQEWKAKVERKVYKSVKITAWVLSLCF